MRTFGKTDNLGMFVRLRFACLFSIVSVAICALLLRPGHASEQPWRGLAERIVSRSDPDSTAVLVLFDEDVVDSLRSRLPRSFTLIAFRHSDVPNHDAFVPTQLGSMYRVASAATGNYSDVWVVGRRSSSAGRTRAARFADMAASSHRRKVHRDSVKTSQGTVEIGQWVDREGGTAQREEMGRAQAWADSVQAVGIHKPISITRPFTWSELQINPDTLSCYVARLADTSFYSIGGCSQVEIVFWNASERLGGMGPGVLPALVAGIADPNPFVRERIQDALLLATQDERVLARTGGDYLRFYDQPEESARDVVVAWWTKFSHYWTPVDSTR